MKDGKIPNPNTINPIAGYDKEIYIKPTIKNKNIIVGDFSYIADSDFESHVTHFYPWSRDKLMIGKFQNSVNIAMCNRVGKEGDMEFSGESIVSDYQGKTVAIAGRDEELLITEVNLSDATITRKKKPYTSLRKPELYS